MLSKVSNWWNGGGGNGNVEQPRYRRQQRERQIRATDNINETLNTLVTQQLQEEYKLGELNAELDANRATWLKQGASGRATLATYIRRRKDLEASIRKKTGQIANLEKMQRTGQEAATAVAMAETMQEANAMVGELTTQVQVEDVEDIYDQFADHVAEVDEIGEATSKPVVGGADPELDDDIAAEIAAMEREVLEQQDLTLPDVPQEQPPSTVVQTAQQQQQQATAKPAAARGREE